MKSKDIAIVGILLAVGAILRYFMVFLHLPLTPNVVIAFYCLSIILIAPKAYEALGIGLVAGVLSMLVTSSIFPPANLISEPVGAMVCFGLYAAIKKIPLSPAASTLIATLASGFTFAAVAIIAVAPQIVGNPKYATLGGFVLFIAPIVIITAIVNAIIVQILFVPANRSLMRGHE